MPGFPLAFIVETEPGVRSYHFGDSAVFGDMRFIGQLHQPTVGLLGCSQPYELLPKVYTGAAGWSPVRCHPSRRPWWLNSWV